MKEWIIRRFKKCGLSIALDGSENARVNIDGIPNCENDSKQFVEEDFKLRDDDEDEDEDASENNENDKIDFSTDISCSAVLIIWSKFTLE